MTHSIMRYILSSFVVIAIVPVAAFAQSTSTAAQTAAVAGSATASSAPNDDLRNAIEASVLADPRVANIPPEQLQGLIVALIAEAQAQHMTAADIMSRPVPQQAAAGSTFDNAQAQQQSTACLLGWQGYLCNFNKVFGFDGNNHTIPIFLLCVTAFLIAVIWELIIHHRKVLAKEAMARAAGTQKKIDPVAGSAKPLV